MDASRSSLQNPSNHLSRSTLTAIAKCQPGIKFFKNCPRVFLLIKIWTAILSKTSKILLNAKKRRMSTSTGMTTKRYSIASRPSTGTTSNTRSVKNTKLNTPLTWTPGSLVVGSVSKVRNCWVSSRKVTKLTPGILRICSTKKTRCYSFQASKTSLVSISHGCILAWSTLLSAGITRTWCSIRSIITTGESLSSGMGYRSHTERTLKELWRKNALCCSRRIQIFSLM